MFKDLDVTTGPLDSLWGVAKALYLGNSSLIPTKSYLNIHNRAQSARASKYASKTIYDALKANEHNFNIQLPSEYPIKRLVDKYILEGKLNGLGLTQMDRNALHDTVCKINGERKAFERKVALASNAFSYYITAYDFVRNFPPNVLKAVAADSNKPSVGPWKINLQPQVVESFLEHCPDHKQRFNVWEANVRKCSGQSTQNLENSTVLEKIRSLRHKQANLLGYQSFAELSMETKMLNSYENAKNVFLKLQQHAGPAQLLEINELQTFALDSGYKNQLEACDIPYWNRKLLQNKYEIDENILKEYFPLSNVLPSLFSLSEKVFRIKIVESSTTEVWQPSVKYYDVFDLDVDKSRPVGGFYIDCGSTESGNKKNSGWMVGIRNRNSFCGKTPLSALIFNFADPCDGKPYLLRLSDLNIIFKTFGTALQHTLTRVAFTDLSGLSNVEWDASQICGEVMASFLNNAKVLKSISGHFKSNETLTESSVSQMKILQNSLASYKLCQEIYYSDLDLELHHSTAFWLDVVKKLWPIYHCMPLEKNYAYPCSMTDIFSGDWAAAYFSHMYSKVIAADIYDTFVNGKSKHDYDQNGKLFKEIFFYSGGSVKAAENFRRFRGRDPSMEAFLKILGII